MAYIVLNSKFTPFTYDEMVKPLREATQVHQATEEQISDLELESGKMEALMNAQSDTKAFNMYRKFNDDLKAQADRLQKEGLTPGTRQEFLKIRGRYGSEIEPIKAASQEYESMMKFRQGLAGKNVIFNNDYSSIDDFLGGRKADNSYVDLDNILAITSAQAKTVGESKVGDMATEKILGGQKYKISQTKGYSETDLNKALFNDPDADSDLMKIVNDSRNRAGYNIRSEEQKAAIDNSIAIGLRSSIFAPESTITNNENYESASQANARKIQNIKLGVEPYYEDDNFKYYQNEYYLTEVSKATGEIVKQTATQQLFDMQGKKLGSQEDENKTRMKEYKGKTVIDETFKITSTGTRNSGVKKEAFDENSAQEVDFNVLSMAEREALNDELKGIHFDLTEMTLYKDKNNIYRMTKAGYHSNGVDRIAPPSPPTKTSETPFNNQSAAEKTDYVQRNPQSKYSGDSTGNAGIFTNN